MNFLHPVYDPIRWIAVEFILKFYHILYWHLSLSYNTVFWFGPIYMYVPYSWVRIIEQKLWVISCFLFQLYDFSAPNECPCAISYHPSRQIFACGFESGVVRVFNVQTTSMLAEHKYAKFYPWSWKKPTLFNMYMNHHFNGVTFEVNELNFLTKKITLVWNTYEVHIPTSTL